MHPLEPADLKSLQAVTVMSRMTSIAIAVSTAILGLALKFTNHWAFDFEQLQSNLVNNQQVQIYTMLALIIFALHLVLPNFILKSNLAPRDIAPHAAQAPAATPAQTKIQQFAAVNVIRLAMIEGSALMGFLIALTTNDATLYVIFAALSIATILATLPNEQMIREKIGLK